VIEFDAPLALATLIVPLVVALALLAARRPPQASTGTLDVWREVSSTAAAHSRRRGVPPLSAWALIASLCAVCLALAGPRLASARDARWKVVVDRSPSMYERHGEGTRLDRALAILGEELPTGVEYVAASADFATAAFPEVPGDWRRAPVGRWQEPNWSAFDDPGVVWLTDSAARAPERASWIAVGRGSASEEPPPLRRIALDPALDPTPLGRAVLAWAQARGYERVKVTSPVALSVALATKDSERAFRCEGRGWSLSGLARHVEVPLNAPSEVLLRDELGALVLAEPGRWEVGFSADCRLEGDDVAFALEISGWLDRAAVGEEDVSPLSPATIAMGAPASPSRAPRSYAALLATLAALLAGLALVLRERAR
jgi:hypothetical protein